MRFCEAVATLLPCVLLPVYCPSDRRSRSQARKTAGVTLTVQEGRCGAGTVAVLYIHTVFIR